MMPTSQILTKTFSAEGTGKNTAQNSRKRAISSEMFQFLRGGGCHVMLSGPTPRSVIDSFISFPSVYQPLCRAMYV